MRLIRVSSITAAMILALDASGLAQSGTVKPARSFEFTYDVELVHVPPHTRTLRVWIPVARSDHHQTVWVEKVSSPVPARITREPLNGDRMLYAVLHNPRSSGEEFKSPQKKTEKESKSSKNNVEKRPNESPKDILESENKKKKKELSYQNLK